MAANCSTPAARVIACQLTAVCLFVGLSTTARPSYAADTGPSASSAQSSRDLAKQSFNRGLTLAREKDYRAAIAAFEHAYQLSPHFMALWNIARCHAALQENDQAVRFFRRYLNEGGTQISPEQRTLVETEIAELQQQDAAQSPMPAQQPPRLEILGAPAGATLLLNRSPWLPGDPLVPGTTELVIEKPGYATWSQMLELSAGMTTTVQVAMTPESPPPTPATEVGDTPTPEPQRENATLAYVLGGVGAGMLVGSAGLFLWNDGRYDNWRKEDTDLQRQIASDGASNETNLRQSTNNDLLQSIETVDVVSVIGGVLGLGLVGTGLYFYLSGSPTAPRAHATRFLVRPGSLQLSGTW
jgi:tetratricopeptide (TPR) repeat protein